MVPVTPKLVADEFRSRILMFQCIKPTMNTRMYIRDVSVESSDRFENRRAMWYFWAIVLFIGVVHRLFAAAIHYRLRRVQQDPEGGNHSGLPSKTPLSGIRGWIKRFITLPATFGYRHQQPYGWCTVPTRITSLIVFAFVAINVILTSVRYHAFQPYL